MNTICTQNRPIDSLFSLYLCRRLIAENVPSAKAERIKRRCPALVVKFTGMVAL